MKKLLLFLAIAGWAAGPAYSQVILKQSTATTVNGKLTKISDGTDHTGLTVTSITAKIIKQSDTLASTVTAVTCAASGSANDCVEVAAGVYNMELSASNTDTVGRLTVCMLASGDYTDCVQYEVIPSASYDSFVTTGPATVNCSGGVCEANVKKWNGTSVPTESTAGYPLVDVSKINNVATSSVTTVNANQGTTQPINFTGTGASALAKSDLVDVAGAAVSTSSAQLGVNAVNVGGTAQTGADLGAQLLLVPKVYLRGTAQSGTSTTIVLASATSVADDFLNGAIVKIMSGTGAGQARRIMDWTNSSDTATISPAWTTSPSSDSVYEIVQVAQNAPNIQRGASRVWVMQFRNVLNELVTSGTPSCNVAKDSLSMSATTNSPSAVDGNGQSLLTLSATDTAADSFFELKCTLTSARDYYQVFTTNGP